MSETINRLLFSGEPYFDESFIGYIMRLADMNEIPDIRWILKTVRLGRFYKYEYKDSFDERIDLRLLSEITGVDKESLRNILYSCDQPRVDFNFLGRHLSRNFITRENPKICSQCLIDNNYCRKIWEFALITTCPIHKCFLLDYCPNCLRRLDWMRPKINICYCGFDFINYKIFHLKEIELRLSKYFYQHFDLYTGQSKFTFEYPLQPLSFDNLMKLLLFIAAQFTRHDKYGDHFFRYFSNNLVHHCLTSAIIVFEDWAENYHSFIKNCHKRNRLNFFQRRPLDLWKRNFDVKTYEYEIFNFIIYEYFQGKQFAFLRREFENFLDRFIAGEILDEPSFFNIFD